jgi:hypothetical protein
MRITREGMREMQNLFLDEKNRESGRKKESGGKDGLERTNAERTSIL